MVTIELSATLPGPPDIVWALITDWEHQDEWMLEASDFVVTSELREGVGVEGEATIRIAGISTRDRVRVVGWEPSHRLALRHLGWVTGLEELFLTPLGDDSTFFFWRQDLEPPLGIAGEIGMRVLKPLMKRAFSQDLRVLAALTRAHT